MARLLAGRLGKQTKNVDHDTLQGHRQRRTGRPAPYRPAPSADHANPFRRETQEEVPRAAPSRASPRTDTLFRSARATANAFPGAPLASRRSNNNTHSIRRPLATQPGRPGCAHAFAYEEAQGRTAAHGLLSGGTKARRPAPSGTLHPLRRPDPLAAARALPEPLPGHEE